MVFKKDLTPLSKKGQIVKHAGKGAKADVLPNRHAISQLTGGSTLDRTMNDYAKATPMAMPQLPSSDPSAGATDDGGDGGGY